MLMVVLVIPTVPTTGATGTAARVTVEPRLTHAPCVPERLVACTWNWYVVLGVRPVLIQTTLAVVDEMPVVTFCAVYCVPAGFPFACQRAEMLVILTAYADGNGTLVCVTVDTPELYTVGVPPRFRAITSKVKVVFAVKGPAQTAAVHVLVVAYTTVLLILPSVFRYLTQPPAADDMRTPYCV